MSKVQTDNSFLGDKIELRVKHLPDKERIQVLDCFAGDGIIWKNIKEQSKKQIKVIGIDKSKRSGLYLHGDNRKFIKTMMLEQFDIIDLDAYGVPYEQLKIIFDREFKGIIFVTFIQSLFGGLPRRMLYEIGYTKEMINKIPSLFNKNGFEKFKRFLDAYLADQEGKPELPAVPFGKPEIPPRGTAPG